MKALKLANVDRDFWSHWQAYLTFCAQAKKQTGKNKLRPVYNNFRKFFDYRKEIEKAKHQKKESNRFKGIGKLL